MAKGNMILTLVAQTTNWAKGLKKASQDAITFGSVVRTVGQTVSSAFLGIAGALVLFLPNFIKMGEEARKSDAKLAAIAESMGLFGKNTEAVTKRLSKYADEISYVTGVQDDVVRSAEAILLTFGALSVTADEVGGSFDRATLAAVDLAAAGFGNVEDNAKQLGKALQDPQRGLVALTRSGVTFTEKEREKIKALAESGNLLKAQEMILTAIEQQVGGTAEATASATDKMSARFENLVETLAVSLLPTIDLLAEEFSAWLDSADGKKAIDDLSKSFQDFGKWITSPDGKARIKEMADTLTTMADAARDLAKFIRDVKGALDSFSKGNKDFFEMIANWSGDTLGLSSPLQTKKSKAGGNPSAPGGLAKAPVTVNVTGITPSATIGKTIQQAVKDAQRLGIR